MRVSEDDLARWMVGDGARFQSMIHTLVRAVAHADGIPPQQIHSDHRVNVPDGGRDIVIAAGGRGSSFLSTRPAIWSLKSGRDEGVDPSALRREILEQPRADHPEVRSALARREAYVWCAACAASQDDRTAMAAAARAIETELGVEPGLIEFRWVDQIADALNRHPNVIAVHLPDVAARFDGVLTVGEWQRERHGLHNRWAGFGEREQLVRRVAEHLLGTDEPNVLHLAGLSGIGKTRTVLHACQSIPQLAGVLYVQGQADLSRQFHRYLDEEGRHVLLVIDEVSLEQFEALSFRFREAAGRLRVVTIGPADRNLYTLPGMVVVPEPVDGSEVLAVLRENSQGLPDDLLASIAAMAGHDLRLALLLARASERSGDISPLPSNDVEQVWRRVMTLFPIAGENRANFRRWYEVLCVAVDVGVGGEFADELLMLAAFFGCSEPDLLRTANTAQEIGLGVRTERFFEASPHALAVGLFESLFRRVLRDRFAPFVGPLPPRLLRRVLERCQECTGTVREEVSAHVAESFLRTLAPLGLTAIQDREPSRVFQAWAEFDPDRGLRWLRGVLDRATREELLALDGRPQAGGWRGRRQLVWMCQNLASFDEYFEDCEAILYRLATCETERDIGNNSTAVWRSYFWPTLAATEVPFDQRLPRLLGRLAQADAENLPLLVPAAVEVLAPPHVGHPVPARVVGGRVAPPPWRPQTYGDLHAAQREAGRAILTAVAALSPPLVDVAIGLLVDHVWAFAQHGLVPEVRGLFESRPLPEEARTRLVRRLDTISRLRRQRTAAGGASDTDTELVQQWRASLTPSATDLDAAVRQLTAQPEEDLFLDDQVRRRYEQLAAAVLEEPAALDRLTDWFDSDRPRTAGYFGFDLGRLDGEGRVTPYFRQAMATGRCKGLTQTYLNGVVSRTGELPAEWASALDQIVDARPDDAFRTTATADPSRRGLVRLLRAAESLPPEQLAALRCTGYGPWPALVEQGERQQILSRLAHAAASGAANAVSAGVHLFVLWHPDGTSVLTPLVEPALELLTRHGAAERGDYWWSQALARLASVAPVEVADIYVSALTDPEKRLSHADRDDAPILRRLATTHPDVVMAAVGRALMDPARNVVFIVGVFRGLFEAIGLETVRRYVQEHGVRWLELIARHLASPTVDATGRVVLPPLTEWLLRDHEGNDRAFNSYLAGRHSEVRVWTGDQTERRREEMATFLAHPLRRVREWAEYEIRHEEQFAQWHRRWDEEDDRV